MKRRKELPHKGFASVTDRGSGGSAGNRGVPGGHARQPERNVNREETSMKRMMITGLAAALTLAASTAAFAQDKKTIAFVVNGPSDFWKIMEAAVARAQTELPDFDLQFRYPERADAAVQRRMMDDLVAAGIGA
ncbi:MAG: hypothetical protein ABJI81_09805, partial [Bauldia litoralis]